MKPLAAIAFFSTLVLLTSTAHAQLYVSQGDIDAYDPNTGTVDHTATSTDGSEDETTAVGSNGLIYEAGMYTDPSGNQSVTVNIYNQDLTLNTADVVDVTATPVPGSTNTSYGSNGITASSDGSVYVLNSAFNASTIISINETTGAVNSTFSSIAHDNYSGLAASSDGSVLFTTDYQLGTIAEISATTGALINQSFATYYDPINPQYGYNGQAGTGQDITVDGNIIYVIDRDDNTVQTFDATTGALLNNNFLNVAENPSTGYFGDFLVSITSEGNSVYVLDGASQTVYQFNASTGAPIGSVALSGSGPIEPGSIAVISDDISTPVEGAPYEGGDPPLNTPSPSDVPEPRSGVMALCVAMVTVAMVVRRRFTSETSSPA